MAQLSGPADRRLILEPTGYQFPGTTGHHDRNWLHVHIHARDARREWSAHDPAFLTWELRDLVAWLRGLAKGEPGLAREFGGIEPCLEFEAEGSGDPVRLRARFRLEFLLPNREWWDTDGYG